MVLFLVVLLLFVVCGFSLYLVHRVLLVQCYSVFCLFWSSYCFVFYSVFVVHFVFSAVSVFRIMLDTSDVFFVTRKYCTECHVLFFIFLMKVSCGLVVVRWC